MKRRYWLILLVNSFILAGCWQSAPPMPDDVEKLFEINSASVEEAKKCCVANDEDGAELAAAKARAAYKKLKKLGQKGERMIKAQTAYRIADSFAERTYEKRRYKSILAGWKASGYKKARKAALVVVFKGLGLAADQAAKGRLDVLPEKVRSKTKLAADLVEKAGGPKRKPDGEPDWPAISEQCFAFSKKPPPTLSVILALGLTIAGKGDLALVELHDVDLQELQGEKRDIARIVKAVSMVDAKLEQLAEDEFDGLHKGADGEKGLDPQIRGGLHVFVAGLYIKKLRFLEADKALARAVRACPNNSVVVYLTGERLAARGEYEKATKSLEKAAAGTKQKWLAKQIQERMRQLRDNPQQMKPMVFDGKFVYRLAKAFLDDPSMKSKVGKQLSDWMSLARRLRDEMWQQLPNRDSIEKKGQSLWKRLPSRESITKKITELSKP